MTHFCLCENFAPVWTATCNCRLETAHTTHCRVIHLPALAVKKLHISRQQFYSISTFDRYLFDEAPRPHSVTTLPLPTKTRPAPPMTTQPPSTIPPIQNFDNAEFMAKCDFSKSNAKFTYCLL